MALLDHKMVPGEPRWGTKRYNPALEEINAELQGKAPLEHVHDPTGLPAGDFWTPSLPATRLVAGDEIVIGKIPVLSGTKLVIDSLGIRDLHGTAAVTGLKVAVYNETSSTEVISTEEGRTVPTTAVEITGPAEVTAKAVNGTTSNQDFTAFVRAHFAAA